MKDEMYLIQLAEMQRAQAQLGLETSGGVALSEADKAEFKEARKKMLDGGELLEIGLIRELDGRFFPAKMVSGEVVRLSRAVVAELLRECQPIPGRSGVHVHNSRAQGVISEMVSELSEKKRADDAYVKSEIARLDAQEKARKAAQRESWKHPY